MHCELIIKININSLQRARCRTHAHTHTPAALQLGPRGCPPKRARRSSPYPIPSTHLKPDPRGVQGKEAPTLQSPPLHHEVLLLCFGWGGVGGQTGHPASLPSQPGLGTSPRTCLVLLGGEKPSDGPVVLLRGRKYPPPCPSVSSIPGSLCSTQGWSEVGDTTLGGWGTARAGGSAPVLGRQGEAWSGGTAGALSGWAGRAPCGSSS